MSVDPWNSALLELGGAATPQLRTEAIDRLTALLEQSDWTLPEGRGTEIAAALRDRLSDNNWSVTQRCLLLVGDLVAELDPEVCDCAAGGRASSVARRPFTPHIYFYLVARRRLMTLSVLSCCPAS